MTTLHLVHDDPVDAFVAYAHWTHDVWVGTGDDPTPADLVVMGYGLPGECSEVVEVLVEFDNLTEGVQRLLLIELGDVAYYLARVANAYGLDLAALARGVLPDGEPNLAIVDTADFEMRARCAMHLTVACGRATEVLKKGIRDNRLDLSRLHASLRKGLTHWLELCNLCGIHWRDALATNQGKVAAKVVERRAVNLATAA